MQTDTNKQAAIDFLELVITGKIDEAYEKHVDMNGKHHNPFTPAGMAALRDGMKGADSNFPNKKYMRHHALADGDLVAIHSHLTLKEGELDMSTFHLFRFENDKIVEIWDCAQNIVGADQNPDGAF